MLRETALAAFSVDAAATADPVEDAEEILADADAAGMAVDTCAVASMRTERISIA